MLDLQKAMDQAAAMAERFEKYKAEGFNLADKGKELSTAKGKVTQAVNAYNKVLDEVNQYLSTMGRPILTPDVPDAKEIAKHLARVFAWFPDGASGEKLADAIGVYGITAQTISDLWRVPGQCVIKREGDAQNTKYFPATEADLEDIARSVAADEAKRKAAKEKKAKK